MTRKSRGQSRIQRKGSFCESKTKKSMYMLINMLKKQYHEVNRENLQMKTRIKKVRKEREKVEREVAVMRELKEDGQLDSTENRERRKRMLLETEWKQKIKRKGEEIAKVVARLKALKKEMKGENLRHMGKELKFHANLNRNLEKELASKEDLLRGFREEARQLLRRRREDLRAKDAAVAALKKRLKALTGEKFEAKRAFNELILDEEMRLSGAAKRLRRPREPSQGEKAERARLKEEIKRQIEAIQGREDEHRALFEEDASVSELRGLHYTSKNEILLNIDSEARVEEDVLLHLRGGRNLELFLELEGVSKAEFLSRLRGALRAALTKGKDKFRPEALVKRLHEKKFGRLPKVLGKVVAGVAETLISERCGRETRNKKIKICKKKKALAALEKAVLDYFRGALQFKVFFKRGCEKREQEYIASLERVQRKLEGLRLEDRAERSEEAWLRYLLVTAQGFSPAEASLAIGSAFWNTKDSAEIRAEDLPRFAEKYLVCLRKKLARRQKEREEREARELEQAALKIQSVFKGKKVRRELAENKKACREQPKPRAEDRAGGGGPEPIPEEIREETEEEIQEEIEEQLAEEVDEQVPEEIEEDLGAGAEEPAADEEMEKAALLIQGKFRQKKAKQQVEEMKKERAEQERAAVMIQKSFKSKQARRALEEKRRQRREEEQAALLIQKRYKEKMAARAAAKSKRGANGRAGGSADGGGVGVGRELVGRGPAGGRLRAADFHDDEPEQQKRAGGEHEQPDLGQLRADVDEDERRSRLQRVDFGGGRNRNVRGGGGRPVLAGHHGQAAREQPLGGRGRRGRGGRLRGGERGLAPAVQQRVLRAAEEQEEGNHVLEPDSAEHPQVCQENGVEHHEETRARVPPRVG